MKYEEYLKWIERAESVEELTEIKERVRKDPELTEAQRDTLIKLYIGRKLKEISRYREIYEAEAARRIEELPVTDELRAVLESYLLVVAPERYTAVYTLRRYVLPYITEFIEFLAKRRGRAIDVDDLDISKLKGADIQLFLSRKTKSKHMQRYIYNYINVFGKWLEEEGYVQKFPKIKIVIPKAPPEVRAERKLGKPRRLEELDRIFSVVSMPMPKVPRERLPIYRYFFKFLLQTGLRPAHALLFKVGDFSEENVEWVEDVWGRMFVKLPSFRIVEREKKERGEIITKKVPAPYVFISESLYNEIFSYCVEEMGWDYDDYICPIPLNTLQKRAMFVAEATGIKDFSLYDFRDTWASVIYNCSGYDVSLIVEMGGWSSSQIPVDIYARTMRPSEAIEIARRYEIFLPVTIREKVEAIEAGKKITITAEDLERRDKLIQELMKKVEELRKELERLKRGEL